MEDTELFSVVRFAQSELMSSNLATETTSRFECLTKRNIIYVHLTHVIRLLLNWRDVFLLDLGLRLALGALLVIFVSLLTGANAV